MSESTAGRLVNLERYPEERALKIQDLLALPEALGPGHAACSGCPAPTLLGLATKIARDALGLDPVVVFATGCMEVVTTLYPRNAWNIPYLHSAFPNCAAAAAGVVSAVRARQRRGELPEGRRIKVIAFAGDGGSYDIGLQALSGAMERGHDLTFICYNNEAYMNTGVQRSSATPFLANTNTEPAGEAQPGKREYPKDLTRIMAAHGVPYVAQAAASHFSDLMKKLKKAIAVKGPAFVNVLSACPVGWGIDSADSFSVTELAVKTRLWPLYEVEDGRTTVTLKPKESPPIGEYLKVQGRYRHLQGPGHEALIAEFQDLIDRKWTDLLRLEEMGKPAAPAASARA
jgi:pyruvate ferredoxin oxidoreductase beta subunit